MGVELPLYLSFVSTDNGYTGRRHKVTVGVERNQVRQAPYVPSASRGMRWRKGVQVPRTAKFPES